jgi:uncharacterized protein YndB with AHSA1/START domain
MSTQAPDLTVRKSIVVDCSPERAFEAFTAEKTLWWPYETHSASGERPERVVYEPRAGGRVYDVLAGGREHDWGTVLAWEPPHRVAVEWKVNPKNPPTELEVRFSPEGEATRVDLEHRGWERYGEEAAESFGSYDSGWDFVLGRYAQAINS